MGVYYRTKKSVHAKSVELFSEELGESLIPLANGAEKFLMCGNYNGRIGNQYLNRSNS